MAGPGRVLLNSSACPLLTVWRSLSGPEWEELGRTEQGAGLGDHARVLLLPRAFLGSAYGGGGDGAQTYKEIKMILGPDSFSSPDHVLGTDR